MSSEDLATEFFTSIDMVIEEYEATEDGIEFFDHTGSSFVKIGYSELPPGNWPLELRLELSSFLSSRPPMGRHLMVE